MRGASRYVSLAAACLVAASAWASPVVLNSSFEQGAAPEWPGYGPIDGWSYPGGSSGRNDTSGPFNNGASVPDGGWVAFTQTQNYIWQDVSGFEAGRAYRVNYYENERGQMGTGEVARPYVTLGGTTVVPEHDIARQDLYYRHVISHNPYVAIGTNANLVLGNNQGAYDNTALWDKVAVEQWAPAPMNFGFEDAQLGPNTLQYTPNGLSGVAWSFNGGSGLDRSGYDSIGFGGPAAEGNQFAFMQGWSEITQTLGSFEDGVTYNLCWLERNRTNGPNNGNNLEVFLDGVSVYSVHWVGNTAWERRTTDAFTVHGTTHTLTFRTYGGVGDTASFVDDIYFNYVVPEPMTIGLLALGGLAIVRRTRR